MAALARSGSGDRASLRTGSGRWFHLDVVQRVKAKLARGPSEQETLARVRHILEMLCLTSKPEEITYNDVKREWGKQFAPKAFDARKKTVQKLLESFHGLATYTKANKKIPKDMVRRGHMVASVGMTQKFWFQWLGASQPNDPRQARAAYYFTLETELGHDVAVGFDASFGGASGGSKGSAGRGGSSGSGVEDGRSTTTGEAKTAEADGVVSRITVGASVKMRSFCFRRRASASFVNGTVVRVNDDGTSVDVQFRDTIQEGVLLHNVQLSAEHEGTVPEWQWFGARVGTAHGAHETWCAAFGADLAPGARRVLALVARGYPAIVANCPLLPALVGILLCVMPEGATVAAVRTLIGKSQKYLVTALTDDSRATVVGVVLRLVKKYAKKTLRHLTTLVNGDVARKRALDTFIWDAFHGMLSWGGTTAWRAGASGTVEAHGGRMLSSAGRVRLMDAYLHEGKKVLYRFVVALFREGQRRVLACDTFDAALRALHGGALVRPGMQRHAALAKAAFGLRRLSRRDIQRFTQQVAAGILSAGGDAGWQMVQNLSVESLGSDDKSRLVTDEPWMELRQVSEVSTGVSASGSNTAAAKTEEEGTAAAPTSAVVRYHPKVFGVTAGENLLDAERMGVVQPFLPPTYQVQDARLLFTTSTDGYDLAELYARAAQHGGAQLILVRPAAERGKEGVVPLVGGFCSVPLDPLPLGVRVDMRNPECLLFRLQGADGPAEGQAFPVCYNEVEPNALPVRQRLLRSTMEFLQIGVPACAEMRNSGLMLDDGLRNAYCGPCDVFGGQCALGEAYRSFVAGVVELYGLEMS